ncbi:phosphopantetheine-binding protein [Streptomyces caelestis]|jgi:mycobactin phenyloxazoline synthetase|uniref:Mycobactin phenyloxazoline synthetase n=1 Tax=Streptomyces caelestis TaxID=36816 RepID=A0A7W9LX22_9ACTN|nr:phosphopantetheine-binding protein [Streptomyces caelestis]MBB5799244.1 mycobactin phenyloxazoline synthetase [Streptomyces caelestis]GGW46280.1 hypothetical protein GCM10010320_28140 [Streptomyces caelestis]
MSGTPASGPTVTIEDVRDAVAAVLRVAPEDVGDDTDLADLGLDSLRVMRLSGRWRRQGLVADFAVLAAEPTVRAWTRYLAGTATEPDRPWRNGGSPR